jgi:glutathione reductase (NADPH)
MRATISGDEGKGFIKLIVAKDSDLLVGAHLVGSEVGEIMQVAPHLTS